MGESNDHRAEEPQAPQRTDEKNELEKNELEDNDLEEAAGGRLPCYPETTSIPPPSDSFEPLGPGV